jgi:integrase
VPHNVRLDTREKRKKLPARHDPYYVSANRSKGIAVGYRKGATAARWYLRRFIGKRYHVREVGRADDDQPADGVTVLSWSDILKLALADDPAKTEAYNAKYSVAQCFADYFTARRAKTRSLESIYVDESRSKPFVAKFGGSQVASLTTDELRRWRDGLVTVPDGADALTDAQHRAAMRASQATANRTWTTCRAALNHAFGSGRVDSDLAWRRIKPFQNVDEAKTRFLSVLEANKLLGASTPHFGDFAQATLLTGLRPGELARLQVGQFQGTRLEVSAGKGDKRRYVSLTTQGVAHFKKLTKGRQSDELMLMNREANPPEGEAPKGKRWTAAEWRRAMDKASEAAELKPRATFYDLRRTYGSLLANARAADTVIAHSLGHADTRMVRRVYGHLLDSMVAAELQAKLPTFKANRRKSSKAA